MANKKTTAGDAGAEQAPSFEQALERLESIVQDLEGGELTLEDSLARYEEGVRLSQRLTVTLDEAEKRIERLTQLGGAPATEPFEVDAERPRREPGSSEGELPF